MLKKSDNAPKFNLHFCEHVECFIAVCFRIFPKVSYRMDTLLVLYHLKDRPRSPGFEMSVFRCIFDKALKKHTLSHLTEAFYFVILNAKNVRPFDRMTMPF